MMATVVFVTKLHLNRGKGPGANPGRMRRFPRSWAPERDWSGSERSRARGGRDGHGRLLPHGRRLADRSRRRSAQGRPRPFARWPPARGARTRAARSIGLYPGDLDARRRSAIDKAQARFMGRAALLGLRAARLALDAGAAIARATWPSSSAAAPATSRHHREIARAAGRSRRSCAACSPTVIPRLMASTVSANLATVLGTTGPSFTAAAACAGGAYNLLLAAQLDRERPRGGGARRRRARSPTSTSTPASTRCAPTPPRTTTGPSGPRAPTRPTAPASSSPRAPASWCSRPARRAEARGRHGPGRPARLRACRRDGDGQTWWRLRPRARSCAMRRALDARRACRPRTIDYVNTHGTSTPVGDVSEVRAHARTCSASATSPTRRPRATPATRSPPPGAIEAIFTLAMLRGGWIAPCVNAEPLDPELVDYPAGRCGRSRARCGTALSQLVRLRRHERDARAGDGPESRD